ncbi:MAG: hypothetical protein LBU58_02420, partial [Clostridiales bacterium]|nr:hypothetical protein [Clostridiales bacterium]
MIIICFDGKDTIRVRGRGIGLRLFSGMKPHEACIPRLDGTWQLSYGAVGEFLLVPLAGGLDVDTEWDWKRVTSGDVTVDTLPDDDGAGGGSFEFAIHFAPSNTERAASYRPFVAPVQLLVVLGLKNAGKAGLARMVAERYLNFAGKNGLALML